jgi:hypothetical protein
MRVTVPTRLQAPDAPWEWWKPQLEAALGGAMNRALPRAVRAVQDAGYPRVSNLPARITFLWGGRPGVMSLPQNRSQLEGSIRQIVTTALRRAAPNEPRHRVSTLAELIAEPLDLGRLLDDGSRYRVPAYDGGGDPVDLSIDTDPFKPPDPATLRKWNAQRTPPSPVDVPAAGNRLLTGDDLTRRLAALELRRAILAGDLDAIYLTLQAFGRGDEATADSLLSFFREFAAHNAGLLSKRLEEVQQRAAAKFQGDWTRTAADIQFLVPKGQAMEETAAGLNALGGITYLAQRISQLGSLRRQWESRVAGFSQLLGLTQAVVQRRRDILDYLLGPPPPTMDDLMRQAFGNVPPPPARDVVQPATLDAIRERTAIYGRIEGAAVLITQTPEGADIIRQVQRDLIEERRWLEVVFDRIQAIDAALGVFKQLLGAAAEQLAEVTALRESRIAYIDTLADRAFLTAEKLGELRTTTEENYRRWPQRAGTAKLRGISEVIPQFQKTADATTSVDQVQVDDYHNRLHLTKGDLALAVVEWQALQALPEDAIDRLTRINALQDRLPLLSVRIGVMLLWGYAHQLEYTATSKSIGDDEDRAEWSSKLADLRAKLAQAWQEPDWYTIKRDLDWWKSELDSIAFDVQMTAREEAAVRLLVGIVVLLVLPIAGEAILGAEAGFVTTVLFEATGFTAAMTVVSLATDKPITITSVAIDFAENVALFGLFRALNLVTKAAVLRYGGDQALRQLVIAFGGTVIAGTLPPVLVTMIEERGWPPDAQGFLITCILLSSIAGAISAPGIAESVRTAQQARQLAELAKLTEELRLLAAEHRAWVAEMDRVAQEGRLPSPDEWGDFQTRGRRIFEAVERVADAMAALPPGVLSTIGLTTETLQQARSLARAFASQIQEQGYPRAGQGTKLLPAPQSIALELVPLGEGILEFNPNNPRLRPDLLAGRLRQAGYVAIERNGTIALRLPGATTDAFLLLPSNAATPPASLARIAGATGTVRSRGLRVLMQQPDSEAWLGPLRNVANTAGEEVAGDLLRAVGRYLSPRQTAELAGLRHYLEIGGDSRALAEVLSPGGESLEWAGAISKLLTTMRKFTPETARGLAALLTVSDRLSMTTIMRIVSNFTEEQLLAVFDITPELHASSTGLMTILRQMATDTEPMAKATMGVLTSVYGDIKKYPGARVLFEQPRFTPAGLLYRVIDYVLEIPGRNPLRVEVKEIYSLRSLGKRAVQQLANDIVDDAAARATFPVIPGGSRPFFETVSWRIREAELAEQAERQLIRAGIKTPTQGQIRQRVIENVQRQLRPAFDRWVVQDAVNRGVLTQTDLDAYLRAFETGLPFVVFF